jgi:hypothetical protein
MAWQRDIDAEIALVISYLGSSYICGGGARTATSGALATMWEIVAPGWCQRRRARFRRSDGKLDSSVATVRGRRLAGRADRTGEKDRTGRRRWQRNSKADKIKFC